MESSEQFTILENKAIGRNIARYRKFRDKIAFEVADYLGISESAYTKYERGESKITIDLIQKVAEFLKVDPLQLVAPQNGHVVENSNSPNSIVTLESSGWTASDKTQTEILTSLVQNVISMNERILKLLEKREMK